VCFGKFFILVGFFSHKLKDKFFILVGFFSHKLKDKFLIQLNLPGLTKKVFYFVNPDLIRNPEVHGLRACSGSTVQLTSSIG
jgi:hypothetical protein